MKTLQEHSISRVDLKNIYDNVCDKWQKIIEKELVWQQGDTVKLSTELIEKGISEASESQKELILKGFKTYKGCNDDIFNVKSFSELCKLKGILELDEHDFQESPNPSKMLALHQITIIEDIYNNGWKPDYSDHNQYKYYPYFEADSKGALRFGGSYVRRCFFDGCVGLYKDQKTSDFVGKTFTNIYQKVIVG